MKELNSERVITPMPKSLVEEVDNYRFNARITSRSEAIRRLIQKGLEAEDVQKEAHEETPY